MKKTILIICLFTIACNPTVSKNNNVDPETDSLSSSGDIDTTTSQKAIIPTSNWNYSSKTDAMDSKESYYAECQSTNEVNFKFPYDGGSSFTLVIRNKKGSRDVILTVSKGQFITDIGEDKRIRIKFDDEKPFYISCVGSDEGGSDIIFLSPESKIINKLKKAKKVTIEPEFYEAGYQQVSFDVSGLEWNH